jgi:hypothetical protein
VRHKIPCSLDEGSDEIAGRSEAAPAALNANLKLTKVMRDLTKRKIVDLPDAGVLTVCLFLS